MKTILYLQLVFVCLVLSVLSSFGQQRVVAFTFDDGPNPAFLKEALPYFQKEGIYVTFLL